MTFAFPRSHLRTFAQTICDEPKSPLGETLIFHIFFLSQPEIPPLSLGLELPFNLSAKMLPELS